MSSLSGSQYKYVPKTYSETNETFASIITYAPSFDNKFFPEYSLETVFEELFFGMTSVEKRLKKIDQIEQLQKAELLSHQAYSFFKSGKAKEGMAAIQEARFAFLDIKKRGSKKSAD